MRPDFYVTLYSRCCAVVGFISMGCIYVSNGQTQAYESGHTSYCPLADSCLYDMKNNILCNCLNENILVVMIILV